MPGTGRVGNTPKLPDLLHGQIVEFTPEMITDWMFVEDGYLVGNYTLRVILSTVSPEERAAIVATMPFKIRD